MSRAEFSKSIKLKAFIAAQGRCQNCGIQLRSTNVEFHHDTACTYGGAAQRRSQSSGRRETAENRDTRQCTCDPDDAPVPCPRKFATHDCWRAAVLVETQENIVRLKNMDRNRIEQLLLDYMMRVRRAMEFY